MRYIRKSPGGWGHISSTDLIHWKRHPNATLFDLSGNAFINKEGIPTIVSGHGGVSVAVAQDDELNVWKFVSIKKGPESGDPDPSQYNLWDPHGWLDGDTDFSIFGIIHGSTRTLLFQRKRIECLKDQWRLFGTYGGDSSWF